MAKEQTNKNATAEVVDDALKVDAVVEVAETKEVEAPKQKAEPVKEVAKKAEKADKVEDAPLVTVNEPTVKLVKVRFIKNHTFNKGTERIARVRGDIEHVESHLANKLVSRNIAYILM